VSPSRCAVGSSPSPVAEAASGRSCILRDAAAATLAALTRGARGAYNVADDEPSPLAVWLPAYARWLGAPAPAPAQVSADEVEDPDARFYAMQLRGASNARVKRELGLRPRRREWLGDTK